MKFSAYNTGNEQIAQRIRNIAEKVPTDAAAMQAYKTIYGLLDLTTLEGADHDAKITELCQKALQYRHNPGIGTVAAVCIYMPFIKTAKPLLGQSGVAIATVGCAFPSGQLPLHLKLAEVSWAASEGADEIDMVISRGLMLEGRFEEVYDEIKAVKAACGKARLKVILETGELKSLELIRKASELALLAGADFLKTSTGKISPAATPEAFLVMTDTIKEYYEATGIKVGIKPAGGIADPETALLYYAIVEDVLGKDWLQPNYFRIGASRLADKLINLLTA